MPRALTQHLDEFSLLRYAAGDMNDIERGGARRHLAVCAECRTSLAAMERLDGILTELGPELLTPLETEELPAGDPFACRPLPAARPSLGLDIRACALAAGRAGDVRTRLLAAAGDSEAALVEALEGLDGESLADRYGLCFALDAARQFMAESVPRWLGFALAALKRLEGFPDAANIAPEIERAVSSADLEARARVLSGFALLWTGDYEQSGKDLEAAYRLHALGAAAESSFAVVEMYESQRRSFLDRPREALILADRARSTFELLGLEVEMARSQISKGLALATLDRNEEAIAEFKASMPLFAKAGFWNAYASAVSNIGASLVAMGRIDEARRQYATAMRAVAGRPAIFAFLRFNLALLLLQGGKFNEAASAFQAAASLFSDQGSRTDSLCAELYQIEALARGGDTVRASELLDLFRERSAELELEPETLNALEDALRGVSHDPLELSVLREKAEGAVRSRAAGDR